MIDGKRALELLEQAVAAKGADHVYQRHVATPLAPSAACRYVHDGEPDCIVGHVLFNSGLFTIEELDNTEGTIQVLRQYRFGDRLTEDAGAILYAAQFNQDSGVKWGIALDAARDKARRLGVIE